jgi:hypothetical protein
MVRGRLQNRNPIEILAVAIIAIIVLFAGAVIFVELVSSLWNLNPLTSIGFVISVLIAILKGHISISKLENNIRILLFIFVGTIVSYAATSQISTLLNITLAGDLIGAIIIGLVIILLWFKGQEIKGWE